MDDKITAVVKSVQAKVGDYYNGRINYLGRYEEEVKATDLCLIQMLDILDIMTGKHWIYQADVGYFRQYELEGLKELCRGPPRDNLFGLSTEALIKTFTS